MGKVWTSLFIVPLLSLAPKRMGDTAKQTPDPDVGDPFIVLPGCDRGDRVLQLLVVRRRRRWRRLRHGRPGCESSLPLFARRSSYRYLGGHKNVRLCGGPLFTPFFLRCRCGGIARPFDSCSSLPFLEVVSLAGF